MKQKKQKKDSGVKRIIGWAVFLPIFLLLFLFFMLTTFAPSASMQLFGFRFLLVGGTRSMEPDLRLNDLIVVTRTDFNSLKIGDTVTFSSSVFVNGELTHGVLITHQIIDEVEPQGEQAGRRFITSGTSEGIGPDILLLTEDGANGTNQFVGRVVFSNRFLGLLLAYLRSPLGITMIAINTVLLLAFFLVLNLGPKETKETKEEKEEKEGKAGETF